MQAPGTSSKFGYFGNPTSKLDERGRLKMPAEFKAFTERKYGKGFNAFYITSMDGESAEIYPLPVWLERQKKIFAIPQSSPARRILLARYNLYGDKADMDPQGRMQIPEELRKQSRTERRSEGFRRRKLYPGDQPQETARARRGRSTYAGDVGFPGRPGFVTNSPPGGAHDEFKSRVPTTGLRSRGEVDAMCRFF